jgi:Phosphotransferase enzyme family
MSESFVAVPGAPRRLRLQCRPNQESRAALAIYRPAHWVRKASTQASRFVPMDLWRPRVDAEGSQLSSLIEGLLAESFPGFALMRSSRPGRYIVGLSKGGGLRHVAKVTHGRDKGLVNEAQYLDQARCRVRAPKVTATLFDDELSVIVTEAISASPRMVPLAQAVTTTVALQCQRLSSPPLVHGDLTVWNLLGTSEEGPCLLDWEAADARTDPWWDLVHFVASMGEFLRAWSPHRAMRLLEGATVVGPIVDAGLVARTAVRPTLRECLMRKSMSCESLRLARYLRRMNAVYASYN